MNSQPLLDLTKLRVLPLAERRSLSRVEDILISPDAAPPVLSTEQQQRISECAERIRSARERGASVMLIYGAHLLRNGAALLIDNLMAGGWINHLATNGAGTIHDWEFAWLGRSTGSVEENVATGTFGTWEETGRYINLAILVGGLNGAGYGESLGQFIAEDGVELPEPTALSAAIRENPADPKTAARAELFGAMQRHGIAGGPHRIHHKWKHASILAQAYTRGIPVTVHPGIGYDIISNHPLFNGAAIGRAAQIDFQKFGAAVERLDGGVVLSIGSAIMGPQVFEKALSCVHNLRLQENRPLVRDHSIYVVDLQDGGNWDWALLGEPPKSNPAYYLRFCKSFSRMGGTMHYVQCDNANFVHALHHELCRA